MRTRAVVAGASGAAAILFATCTVGPAPFAPTRGAALYEQHCAICHGREGEGDTAVAELLRPRPAPFRLGAFALVSTRNGVPTDDDLVGALRRGMPGSTMMSWDWLPEGDLRDLAREVRRLATAGRARAIERAAAIGGVPIGPEQAWATAERELEPAAPVDAAPAVPPTEANIAAGRLLFARRCASCHGDEGRGLTLVRDWPEGAGLWPRDLAAGYVRGGATHGELSRRIVAGMPGVGMPAAQVSAADAALLAVYVQSLFGPDGGDRHVQRRRAVPAVRVQRLPGDDDSIDAVAAVRLPLAPLWWRPGAPEHARVRAVHDGERLLLELDWADGTRDDRARPDGSYGDGVAVQWTNEPDAPLVGMGSPDRAMDVWRWRAYDPKETAGMVEVTEWLAHAGLDAPAANWRPNARAESLALRGIGSVASATSSGLPLAVRATWHDGRWRVRLQRSLRAHGDGQVDLSAAPQVLFALAVWDGSIDRHAGSKAITTWHVLELQR